MNQERFDELTKALAAGKISRGSALKMMGAALVGAVLASGRGAALADTQCKPLLKKCNKNAQCCSGNCIESPQGSGKVCGCAAGQTLCPANNSCVQDCPPGQTLNSTTCRCSQCQNASDCPTPDNECQRAACTNGLCGVENVPDGTSCDDMNECTTNDVCTAGVCAGTLSESCVRCQADPDCAEVPVDQCHRAVCGAQGFCVVEALPDSTSCDDGDPCTEGDVCTAGVCAGTQIGDCVRCQNDGDCSGVSVDNQCHEAVCTQAGVCAIQDKADGTPCDDGQACTENDVCIAGVCGRCVTVDNSNPEAPISSPCEEPCATQGLYEQAEQDIKYSLLVDYLTKEGFALDAGPYLYIIQENGTPVGKLLSSRFLNPTRPSEAAGLHYYVEAATGDSVASAVVVDEQQQTVLYTLAEWGDGEVHKLTPSEPPPQTSLRSTFSTAGAGGGLRTQTSDTAGAPSPITSMQSSFVGGCCTELLEICRGEAEYTYLRNVAVCTAGCIAAGVVTGGLGLLGCAVCLAAAYGDYVKSALGCERAYGCRRRVTEEGSMCVNNVCCRIGQTGCGASGSCVEGGGTKPSPTGTCCERDFNCCYRENPNGGCYHKSDPRYCGSCVTNCIEQCDDSGAKCCEGRCGYTATTCAEFRPCRA